MRKELTQIEYIENYLEGKLGKEEREKFEEQLLNDSELKDAVELQRVLVERVEAQSIRKIVKNIHNSNTGGRFKLNLFILGLAVLAAGAGYLFWNNSTKAILPS